MNTRQKGNRNERKAVEFLEERGYICERQNDQRYSNNDYFNKFDILGLPTTGMKALQELGEPPSARIEARPILVQVKSNTASGINKTQEWIKESDVFGVRFFYMVWHDYEGWRIISIGPSHRSVILDERE